MFRVQDFFMLGMKKPINSLIIPFGKQINLGCGNHKIDDAHNMDLPEFDFNSANIPYSDNSIGTIHMYHFLEHLDDPIRMLKECQRVLKKGGAINIVVPYYNSNQNASDLTHKFSFTENTWNNLFNCDYYDNRTGDWELSINFNMILGIEERCLALFTQLVKNG